MLRLLLVLGGTASLSLGVLAACSNDDQFLNLPTTQNNAVDSGNGKPDDDQDQDEDEDTDGGTKRDAGDGGGACTGAGTLKSVSDVFCFNGTDGKPLYCKPHPDAGAPQVCCGDSQDSAGKFATMNQCAAAGECTGKWQYNPGNEYACLEQRHCGTGQQCCLVGGPKGVNVPRLDTKFGACGNYFTTDYKKETITGSTCKTTCGATDLQLCSEDSDCQGGKVCKYLKVNGRNSGFCKDP